MNKLLIFQLFIRRRFLQIFQKKFNLIFLFIIVLLFIFLFRNTSNIFFNGVGKKYEDYTTEEIVKTKGKLISCNSIYPKLESKNPLKFAWIAKRIKDNCKSWDDAILDFDFSKTNPINILLIMGVLIKENSIGFASRAFSGGPLGELVQWADIITSLSMLGHNITIISEIKDLVDLNNKNGFDHFEVIFSDYLAMTELKENTNTIEMPHSFKCKLRIVDSFGTEAEFNSGFKTNTWGLLRINLKQYYTMFPHTPDNSFLGYAIFNVKKKVYRDKLDIAIIYAKDPSFLNGNKIQRYLEVISEYFELHCTFSGYNQQGCISHGVMKQNEYFPLLDKAKLFIGVGFPFEGPAPLEAIARGCVFLNPILDYPISRINSSFLSEKPTFRSLKTQNDYCAQYVNEEFVRSLLIDDEKELRNTLQQIKSQTLFHNYIPHEFTSKGMLDRLSFYLLTQNFCNEEKMRKHLKSKTVIIKQSGLSKSCNDACSLYRLICEPLLFKYMKLSEADDIKCKNLAADYKFTFPSTLELIEGNISCIANSNLFYSCSSHREGSYRWCPCRNFTMGNIAIF